MTRDKDFKKLVRNRMRKTGESYTTSRTQLMSAAKPAKSAAPARPTPAQGSVTPTSAIDVSKAGMADATIATKTGRTWSEWVAVLDAAGAAAMSHRDIARLVHERMGVPGWWSQAVTVGYERIRGLRDVGQRRSGGYEVNKSKTCAAPVAVLFRAVATTRNRNRWLPDVALTIRTATAEKSMRVTWPDGTDVHLYFIAKGADRSQITVQHGKLSSRAEAERMREYWGERLTVLATLLAKPRR